MARASETRRRRLIAAQTLGRHTRRHWEILRDTFGQCVMCGDRTAPLVKDHIKPIANGGCDCLANLQPLCTSCNSSKGARSADCRFSADPEWFVQFECNLEHAGI